MKRLAIATLIIAILTSTMAPSMAIDLKSAKNAKSNVDSRISQLHVNKKKALAKKARLENQKEQVANTQAAEGNAYKQLVSQISDARENLQKTDEALEQAQSNYNQQRELVKTRLKVMYENSSGSLLDTLFESKSIVEFYERMQYMSLVSQCDKKLIDDLNDAKCDVEYKKKLQQQAKQLLERRASAKQDRLTSLKASRADLENQIARSRAELDKIEKEEDALIAQSKKLTGIINSLTKKGRRYAGGSMTWPVPSSSNITSTFGMRKHPILRKYKMHTGIDIAASYGNSIVAANKGTVIIAQYDRSGGYGRMVVIDHGGGITTLYGHCSKLLVSVGQEVAAGQVIAKIGSTGLSTGNHCHFEVRKNGVPRNPLGGYLK